MFKKYSIQTILFFFLVGYPSLGYSHDWTFSDGKTILWSTYKCPYFVIGQYVKGYEYKGLFSRKKKKIDSSLHYEFYKMMDVNDSKIFYKEKPIPPIALSFGNKGKYPYNDSELGHVGENSVIIYKCSNCANGLISLSESGFKPEWDSGPYKAALIENSQVKYNNKKIVDTEADKIYQDLINRVQAKCAEKTFEQRQFEQRQKEGSCCTKIWH